ncbi:putative inorganic phosphate cotransporter [Thelohanellus kitauei]|uniref:Putative inorganic phosphate cotransporter n=1 Tax=Thelohanellus kitauei TaxID=669202 RepID=A0A0C2MEW1_THEKT|nr:putative inorganic phosphate cotransporter [Thelohanellus kitauei]
MGRYQNFHQLRVIICLVAWVALLASYSQRINLSIGIIGMVSEKPLKLDNDSNCPIRRSVKSVSFATEHTTNYEWDESMQNYLLLAYNVGYMLGHIPGAFLALHFGSRYVMIFSLISSSLLTISSVFIVQFWWLFFFVRVLTGFVNGPVIPLIHETIAYHSPPDERTVLTMFTHTGNLASLILILPLGGILIENYANGWKYIFIISGLIGVLAAVLWTVLVFSEPEENPWMSKNEQIFINESIYPNGKPPKNTIMSVPFKSIFNSRHFYVFTICHFGKLCILYMNLFGIVKYFYKYYTLSPRMAGNLAVVPFVADFIFQLMYPQIVVLMKKTGISLTSVRKLNTFIGSFGSSTFLICLGFISCHDLLYGIVLMSLCSMFLAPYQAGYFTAIIEYAPRYAGIVYSFVNVGGTFSGVAQRYLMAFLASKIPDLRLAYQYSFIITGFVSFVFSMVYVIFGTADLQPWAKTGDSSRVYLSRVENKQSEKN